MTATATHRTAQQQYVDVCEKEHATTVRVLRAYPADKLDLQPHARCKSARDLAWMFVLEQGLLEKALTTGLDWSRPSAQPKAPSSMDAIIEALQQAHKRVVELVRKLPDGELHDPVSFFVAPKTLGDVPTIDFLWFILHDQIHHRGQFSIYLRMADGKVPSIYGPSADETWF